MEEIAKKVKLLERIDADSITIIRDYYFPNAYIIDLPLDSLPNHVWQDIFEREWKSSRHLWDRKLFVIGDKLRLVTNAYDIEDKLDWVKQVIERTNVCIDQYNQETEARKIQREQVKKQTSEEEKASVDLVRDMVRRRFGAI